MVIKVMAKNKNNIFVNSVKHQLYFILRIHLKGLGKKPTKIQDYEPDALKTP